MRALAVALWLMSASAALGQTVPNAPDQSQGMALMSAIVEADGSLVSGSGAVSSLKSSTGRYYVTFHRPVKGCAVSAVVASAAGLGAVLGYAVVYYLSDPNQLYVILNNPTNNTALDTSFHLMVFCPK